MVRFEILKAIWDVPVKNNNDENNSHATFLAKALSFIVQSKNGMNEMDRCSKDAANDQFNDPCHLNATVD